ncbi:MAG: serine/threonine protein kinase [Planctomycetota bacterium]|jgi:serine/threonine protein kinase
MSADPKNTARLLLRIQGDGRAPTELPGTGRLVIGSDAERVDLVLEGQGVDKVHCAIGRVKNGGWALKDLGSEFGTMLNGKNVEAGRISLGDEIVLGARRLEVVEAGASTSNDKPRLQSQSQRKPEPKPKPKPKAKPTSTPEIPGFRVHRRLGRGGSGEVWLATQVSLDREVALKLLRPHLAADSVFVKRFQDEARAAAALGHPNVVTVYDVGEGNGQHFLSMEYMARGCLEQHLANTGPLPWREVLEALRDASRGLEYAESRGLVHRDIKPANLMRGEDGTVRIADLGLAAAAGEAVDMGAEGGKRRIQGTPHFLAPEIIRGGPPERRSDLYALGVTAYRLLSGKTPFDGSSATDILRSALHSDPQDLSELAPACPDAVVDLVHRLFERDPADRPANAAAVRLEAEALLQNAGRPTQDVVGAPSKSSAGIVTGGIAVLALVAIGAWQLLGGGDPAPPTDSGGSGNASISATGSHTTGPEDPDSGKLISAFDGQTEPDETEPVRDDEAEQRFEERAELAYLRLGGQDLTDEQRIGRLRTLAETYKGTTTATTAALEAESLAQHVATVVAEDHARSSARELLLASLTSAADLDAPDRRPGNALRALAAVEGQDDWVADEAFQTARKALIQRILEQGRTRAEALDKSVAEHLEKGRFEEARQQISALLALVDIPESLVGANEESVERMRALAAQARVRASKLVQMAEAYANNVVLVDEGILAAGLGGPTGFEYDLLSLDLGTAQERLGSISDEFRTPEAKIALEPLQADLILADQSLRALLGAWNQDQWRRKTVLVPDSSGRTRASEVSGISSRGLQLADGPDVPWKALMRLPKAMDNLFKERLARDWTPTELQGVATLVRLSAVLGALHSAEEMLPENTSARFTKGEAEELTLGFSFAQRWVDILAEPARSQAQLILDQERGAAEALAAALLAVGDERPADAATLIERLFAESSHTLLLRLLSDGSDWRPSPADTGKEPETETETETESESDLESDPESESTGGEE